MTLIVQSAEYCKCGSHEQVVSKDGSKKCAGCKSPITQTLKVITKKESNTMASKKDVTPKAVATKVVAPAVTKNEHGFKAGSKSAKIYDMLLSGKYTKADMEKATESVGKSTVSVFLGDLQKAVGTYPVSRGVKVVEDEKTHHLSVQGAEKKATKAPAKKVGKVATAHATA